MQDFHLTHNPGSAKCQVLLIDALALSVDSSDIKPYCVASDTMKSLSL